MSYIPFELITSISIKDVNHYATLALRSFYPPEKWDRMIEIWAYDNPSDDQSLQEVVLEYLQQFGLQGTPKKVSKELLNPTQEADLRYAVFATLSESDLYEMNAQDIYSLMKVYLDPDVEAPDRAVLEFAVDQLNNCNLTPEYQGLYEDRLFELEAKITRAEDELVRAWD